MALLAGSGPLGGGGAASPSSDERTPGSSSSSTASQTSDVVIFSIRGPLTSQRLLGRLFVLGRFLKVPGPVEAA